MDILLTIGFILFMCAVAVAFYGAGRADSLKQKELDLAERLAALKGLKEQIDAITPLLNSRQVRNVLIALQHVRASIIDRP